MKYAYTTVPAGDHIEFAYQCRLPLSTQTLRFPTGLSRTRLKKIGSRWRKLPAGRIAVIVPAALRDDQHLSALAGGNAISRTTVDRWLNDGSLVLTEGRTGLPVRRGWSAKHERHCPPGARLGDHRIPPRRHGQPCKVWKLLLQRAADQVGGDLHLGVGHAKSPY
ncbi:hypothetical protein [Streptomyces sp. NPDC047079]|uniref:hypothetical protein n=1 Tax=Streptomyces sp. NPDC047079 TaxID=3154607 RepID=UPI0033C0D626